MTRRKKRLAMDAKCLMEELYHLYEQKMYAAAFGILRQAEQAEDAVHETFIKLAAYLPQMQQCESEETKRLVMRILKTTAIDQYRKNSRDRDRLAVGDYLMKRSEMMVFPIKEMEDKEFINKLLQELPFDYLDVVRLRCYFGFTNRETAQILEISESAVAKRLERARKLLKENMVKEDGAYGQEAGRQNISQYRRIVSGRAI